MAGRKMSIMDSFQLFTAAEKRNIAIYVAGIMLYKFGLEAFNGSITALATNRYDRDADRAGVDANTFEKVGLLQGLNQAFQCVGSILIAPLIKRFPTRLVLSVAIFCFGILTAVLLIVDGSTGGRLKPKGAKSDDFSYYGNYNTDGIIPIYCFTGIAYGMVELIRRVIPRDIVGGNVQKLRRMDALVHIFYEVAGTAGAFCTALGLIPALGNNMSFIITPICFTLASITWFFVSNLNFKRPSNLDSVDKPSYFKGVITGFVLFYKSVYTGAIIIFTSRKFIWLLPGYSLALYGHRYLENGIAPIIARRYLGNSAWSQIMVGGSNFGELLGAGFVFIFTNLVTTPIPWLRLDALFLLIVWYLPYWTPPKGRLSQAWMVAATFLPVSFGWAAGDVSLAAYIQASLARKESEHPDVSALGAVMAFLYSTYIVIYAITQPLLGKYVDRVFAATGGSSGGGTVQGAIQNIAGVQFTIISICMLAATCVPKGAIKLNPTMLYGEALDKEVDHGDDDSSAGESLKAEKIEKSDNYGDLVAVAQPGGRNSIVGTLQPVDDTKRGMNMS
jgi:hypothetical protein